MIKTTEKYADGRFVYLHKCSQCDTDDSARGTVNAKGKICAICTKTNRQTRIRKHKPAKTHGLTKHPFYERWKNIHQRCFNENNPRYHDWGGRGITVCDEWKKNAKAFIDYISALKHAGEKGYSLDRKDNDGNYEPGNIRWATATEQNNNQRKRRTNGT